MDQNDLPLISNINKIRARHYLLKLQTSLKNKIIHGCVIIFFDVPSTCELEGSFCSEKCVCLRNNGINSQHNDDEPLTITLECNDLIIENVFEIKSMGDEVMKKYLSTKKIRNDFNDFLFWKECIGKNLSYTQDDWSITIQKDNHIHEFPLAISINYSTKPEGNSIYWRSCEDGELCFFTPGSLINNRSLFPSQDRPFAMGTWQTWVIVPEEFYVSMTGDDSPLIVDLSKKKNFLLNFRNPIITEKMNCYYYFTTMALPVSTIAISCGKWLVSNVISKDYALSFNENYMKEQNYQRCSYICNHMLYPCHFKLELNKVGPLIPVTLVTSAVNYTKAKYLLRFIKFLLIAAYNILGIHPLRRLEIVILPRCFPHLGLASPNLMFLSASVIIDDSFIYLRLAHEISHSWFGITIGPKNCEEEWLSEGFATYLEDSIFVRALEESQKERENNHSFSVEEIYHKYEDFLKLRGYVRYKLLVSEKENCSEDLQILSPEKLSPHYEGGVVSNGLNANKSFIQVHYLKGHFLLHYLCNKVSRHEFDKFLGIFVSKFHGQLVTSNEFLDSFYENFPSFETIISKSSIIENWLKNSDINSEIIESFNNIEINSLMKVVNEHYNFWILRFKKLKPINSQLKSLSLLNESMFIYSDQIVILLEKFLQCRNISGKILRNIHSFYKLSNRNPDIKHRWCELIIKYNYPDKTEISSFLMENQAMGVYLYGELIISGKVKHKKLAKDIFFALENELCINSKKVISSMIFA